MRTESKASTTRSGRPPLRTSTPRPRCRAPGGSPWATTTTTAIPRPSSTIPRPAIAGACHRAGTASRRPAPTARRWNSSSSTPRPFISSYRADGGEKVKISDQDPAPQLAWFEAALAKSTADWKLVIGHHPVWSGGGGALIGGEADLQERLDPILQRHRIPLYLNGHDHDLQHVARGATHYVCTGAGSKVRNDCKMAGSDFCSLQSGFTAFSLTGKELKVAYRDYTGAELKVVEIPRPV